MPDPKRILLAGSTGYVGGVIARRWAALGLGRLGEVRVRGLSRNLDAQPAGELRAADGYPFLAWGVPLTVSIC